jgi:hypothetical protein
MNFTAQHFTSPYLVVLCLFVILMLNSATVSYGQSLPGFTEIGVFGGDTLNPTHAPTVGVSVGGGEGKDVISLQYVHESWGDYSPNRGLSYTACVSGCSTPPFEVTYADTAAIRVTLNYSRDLFSRSRFALYGTAGGGILKMRWTSISHCDDCTQLYQSASTILGTFGGGMRVPVAKKFGVRAEMNEWINGSNSTIVTNHVVAVTVGLYYRWFRHM